MIMMPLLMESMITRERPGYTVVGEDAVWCQANGWTTIFRSAARRVL